MLRWGSCFAAILVILLAVSTADAGFGVRNLALKAGLDVVQSNDTRHFFSLQSDIATVFSKRMLLEVSGEMGVGTDLDGSEIKVVGGGGFLRYMWPNASQTAFAYMGGGLGLTRVRRWLIGFQKFDNDMQTTLHLILIGMEKHLSKGRLKALCEVRWVLGEEEDGTALRAAVGLGVNFGKP
ncbi:MAG: hypothetical protein O3B73_17710 [bacterium]|jgi:hypothetical protein|nr:hypothetical protein [bacterium]